MLTETKPSGALALVVSGILGWLFGLAYRDWQVAVETAQVVAGLVHYPPDNPFFIYHVKLWTVLHQGCAVLLRLGFNEIAVSTIVSGLLGQISFQAIAMTTFAVSRRTWLSIGVVLVVLVSGVFDHGVIYPIALIGTSHTYGALGLSMLVLVIALLGSGWWRSGALLLGLMPAIHPSLGFWLTVIVAVCLIWDWRGTRELRAAAWRAYAAGAVLTSLSLGYQLLTRPALPPVAAVDATRFLTQFVTFWDGHRQPVELDDVGVKINLFVIVISLLFLWRWRETLTSPARLLLRTATAAGVIGIGVAWLSHLPAGSLPLWFLVAMPSRVLNVDVLIAAPLLLGLIGRFERVTPAAWLMVASLAAMLGADHSEVWKAFGAAPTDRGINPVYAMAGAAVLLLVIVWWWPRRATPAAELSASARLPRLAMTVVLVIAATAATINARTQSRTMPATIFVDRSNTRVFAMLDLGQGVVATGGDMHLVQLRTRRPVLIDGGGLDGLPYALEATDRAVQILRDLYGIDFYDPPPEARKSGKVPNDLGRIAFERHSLAEWRTLRKRYGITDVMVPDNWNLDLPETAAGSGVRLYAIPE